MAAGTAFQGLHFQRMQFLSSLPAFLPSSLWGKLGVSLEVVGAGYKPRRLHLWAGGAGGGGSRRSSEGNPELGTCVMGVGFLQKPFSHSPGAGEKLCHGAALDM